MVKSIILSWPGTAGKDSGGEETEVGLEKKEKPQIHRERAMRSFYRKGSSLWANSEGRQTGGQHRLSLAEG